MERTPINSTLLSSVAYDAETQTLEVCFRAKKAGDPEKVYHYTPFTAADWEAWQAAESKGSHFLRVVKPGFRCTKIEEKKEDGTVQS